MGVLGRAAGRGYNGCARLTCAHSASRQLWGIDT
jgi:hypothetical protein